MKVLLLVQDVQRANLDRLYETIARYCDCDIQRLSDDQQANLEQYFNDHVQADRYDRIVFFLRFKKEILQRRFIRTVPNLVILEHDACRNYLPGKYKGKFSEHYRALPWARVICSGYGIAEKLRGEGFDAVAVAKGYDDGLLRNLQVDRPIELGFVGSTGNKVYRGRYQFLQSLQAVEPLEVVRTESGQAYLEALNRVRFFVSADIGFDEYMLKNFEAMACGCVLLAYDQGEIENRALGFVDMGNVILYRDLVSLQEKLHKLRAHPEQADAIARAGQKLVEERWTFDQVGRLIAEALEPPLRRPKSQRWLGLFKRVSWEPAES